MVVSFSRLEVPPLSPTGGMGEYPGSHKRDADLRLHEPTRSSRAGSDPVTQFD